MTYELCLKQPAFLRSLEPVGQNRLTSPSCAASSKKLQCPHLSQQFLRGLTSWAELVPSTAPWATNSPPAITGVLPGRRLQRSAAHSPQVPCEECLYSGHLWPGSL